MTKPSDSPNKMTAKEYAALHMKVPQSGTDWLDEMIGTARELDAEAFEAKLKETPEQYEQANTRTKRPRKEPGDQKD